MSIHAVLVFKEGTAPELRRCVRLDPARPITIGRSSANDIVVSEPFVSSRHIELHLRDGELWATDLGSKNGTWIERGGDQDTAARLEPNVETRLDELPRLREKLA